MFGVGKSPIRAILQIITIVLRPNVALNLSTRPIAVESTIRCKFLSFLDRTSLQSNEYKLNY